MAVLMDWSESISKECPGVESVGSKGGSGVECEDTVAVFMDRSESISIEECSVVVSEGDS